MNTHTIVLPSARAIRHEQLHITDSSIFLPSYLTMGEFISKLCVVKDFKYIDDDSRILLLLEASDFKEFSSLQIERNFFTFTKNSSYIFKFFEELSAEIYDISQLNGADLYAEFEEHISILQELYKRYELLCNERKFLDKIFIPKLYEFNINYALRHQNIELHLNGHLTNFEFELLFKCCEFSHVKIIFSTTAFNLKMQSKFIDMGMDLEAGYKYTISLNEKEILSKESISKNSNVSCESFSESLLQVGFIKQKIYEFVNKGYKPENIAVILPSESSAQVIKSFDNKANLNFAMGEPYSNSELYVKLHATAKAIDLDSKENLFRIQRVGDELYMKLHKIYYKNSSEVDFISFLDEIKELFTSKQELKIFEEEIYSFKKVVPFMKEMSLKSLLSVFMQRLSQRTIDDVRGGKITVMGVLETRSVSFDAVIIIDFSDKNVPKRSDKDMFLNSAIREHAHLPTMSDRENLQKHYYEMLINSSKEVAISFVGSSDSSPSRFLKQLNIIDEKVHDELEVANILFTRVPKESKREDEIVQEYSFKDVKLSSTRLKTYLTCKRKYYHKYVQHLKSHNIPTDMPQEYEIGNVVHLALKELYSAKNTYSEAGELQRDLDRELDKQCGKSELDKYLIAIQKKRLSIFCHKEIERFNDGWSVHSCEESFTIEYAGMTLIGQIDRIDKRENEVEVIDYKTGSYTLYTKNSYLEAVDFQLEFYHLLAAGEGNVVECGFYDLKESRIVPEAFLTEKLEILKSHIKDLLQVQEINFLKCEDTKSCQYCEFRVMCGRD